MGSRVHDIAVVAPRSGRRYAAADARARSPPQIAREVRGVDEVALECGEKDLPFPQHPFAIELGRGLRDLAEPGFEVALESFALGVGDDRLPRPSAFSAPQQDPPP